MQFVSKSSHLLLVSCSYVVIAIRADIYLASPSPYEYSLYKLLDN